MSIISKIIAAIMSFFMLFFPGGGDGGKTYIDVDDIKVVDDYEGKTGIIADYNTWKKTSAGAADKKYNEEFFKDNSLVAIGVTRPSPGYEVIVKSAVVDGSKLEVEYELEELPGFFIQILAYSTIIVPVSKDVKTYSASKI